MKTYTPKGYTGVTVAEVAFEEIESVDIALCKQPTETVDKYYKRQTIKPDVITNCGFFTMSNGQSQGCICVNGDWLAYFQKSKLGLLFNGSRVEFVDLNKVAFNGKHFIGGYPVLINEYKCYTTDLAKELDYKTRRTVIGYNDDSLFIVCVDKPGLTFTGLKTLLTTSLGCKYAINVDGGGSTRMLVNGVRKTANVYNRPVDTVLTVKLKPYNRETTYPYGKGLNYRSGPGTTYKILGNYPKGTKVVVYEKDGKWARTDDGWVNSYYLK